MKRARIWLPLVGEPSVKHNPSKFTLDEITEMITLVESGQAQGKTSWTGHTHEGCHIYVQAEDEVWALVRRRRTETEFKTQGKGTTGSSPICARFDSETSAWLRSQEDTSGVIREAVKMYRDTITHD